MQKSMSTLVIILSFTLLSQAQNSKPNLAELSHQLNVFQSEIIWKGSYLLKFTDHVGTVAFKKGKLFTKDGAITGGEFIIDMTSITSTEHQAHKDDGPVEHLKNSDFFDVIKYPEASLHLTKVTYYSNTNEHRFEGGLTIKGITKPIMIKAMVDDMKKSVKTRFKIDRQEWGIDYKSKFKDSAISDAIEFDVTLQFE